MRIEEVFNTEINQLQIESYGIEIKSKATVQLIGANLLWLRIPKLWF